MPLKRKKSKDPAEIVFNDRWLTGEREEDNPYVTCALYFLVVLMSLLLIMVVFVSMCMVDGTSMMNTHKDRDNVLLYKFARNFKHDDVVVFDIEENNVKDRLIKRVVGVAGDELVFVKDADGVHATLYRKDAESGGGFNAVTEEFIKEPMRIDKLNVGKLAGKIAENTTEAELARCRIAVEDGFIYVMGDNRNDSRDSRYFGAVITKSVVGKEIFHFTQGSLLEKIMLVIFGGTSPGDTDKKAG